MKALMLLLILLLPTLALAQKSDSLNLYPIIGLERVQKIEPTPHTKSRLIYGLGLRYGPPALAAEAEVTRGSDDESFPDRNLMIKETATNVMLGLRSSFQFASLLRWYLRAGGHARKTERERTENGVTSETDPAVYVSPYAGTGLSVNVLNKFTINGGVTVIFTGKPKVSDHEYQTTLGFGLRF